ncbi:MAG: 50S ribosomal protein L21 [Patescibacteria group bacterium]
MFSVIETGGKQYFAAVGKKIKVEKLPGAVGDMVVFDRVLLTASSDDDAEFGVPYIAKTKVQGEIIEQGKAEKVIVFRYKAKKRQHTKKGHRQPYTEVKITDIKA